MSEKEWKSDANFVRMMRIRYGWAASPTSTQAEIERLIMIATARFQDPPPPLPNRPSPSGEVT